MKPLSTRGVRRGPARPRRPRRHHRCRHAPRQRRRPPRRPVHQAEPSARHHRHLRLQVDRRDDPRPERQSADQPGRQQDREVQPERHLPVQHRPERRRASPTWPTGSSSARCGWSPAATSSRTTRSSARTGASARTERLDRHHGRHRDDHHLQAVDAPDRAASPAAARPSSASVTTRSSSTCRASSSSRSSSWPARPTSGVLLGGFTGTDTFAGTNVSSIAIEVPNARLGGTGQTVGVWGTVLYKQNGIYHQVERMGRPAINTVFNNTNAEKEAANRLRPSDDRAFDKDNVIATLERDRQRPRDATRRRTTATPRSPAWRTSCCPTP